MDGNKINLLKSYFTAFQLNNEFYSYADLARYLGISTAIVKNVYTDRTVFPSKKLTKHLSERFNKNPEAILADIYESCNTAKFRMVVKVIINEQKHVNSCTSALFLMVVKNVRSIDVC